MSEVDANPGDGGGGNRQRQDTSETEAGLPLDLGDDDRGAGTSSQSSSSASAPASPPFACHSSSLTNTTQSSTGTRFEERTSVLPSVSVESANAKSPVSADMLGPRPSVASSRIGGGVTAHNMHSPNHTRSGYNFGTANTSSFSWRQFRSMGASNTSGNAAVTASTFAPAQAQAQRFHRAAYALLHDYVSKLDTEVLRHSLQNSLTMMLMDLDVVTSLEFPSVDSHGTNNAAAQSILGSPSSVSARGLQQRTELAAREQFKNFTHEDLVRHCCAAHSALVVLADLLGAPTVTPTPPRMGAGSISVTVASPHGTTGRPKFVASPEPYTMSVSSAKHVASSKSLISSGVQSSSSSSTAHTSSSGPHTTSSSASVQDPQEAGRAAVFNLDNVAYAQSVMAPLGYQPALTTFHGPLGISYDGSKVVDSVASQCIEPVSYTDTAKRSKDDLGVKMINNYILLDNLGKGTHGKVKLGYNVDKGQSVAIKVVRRAAGRNHMSGQAARARVDALHREIAVMKKLRHKNIVSLYEVIDDPEAEKLYLVMQYVDDGPIGRMKPDGTCTTRPPDEVAMYGRQVCAGLEYLHSKGIVHRDIKPENILVSSNKQAYLADFGVSEIFAPEQSGAVRGHKGTPLFMAPEVWRDFSTSSSGGQTSSGSGQFLNPSDSRTTASADGDPPAVPRIQVETSTHHESGSVADADDDVDGFALDIWALGVTFYMLLYGVAPFPSVDVLKQPTSQFKLTFPDMPSIPQEWVSLLKRMLEVKSYKRPKISVVRQSIKSFEKKLAVEVQPAAGAAAADMQFGSTGVTGIRRQGTLLAPDEIFSAVTPRVHAPSSRASSITSVTLSPNGTASRRRPPIGSNRSSASRFTSLPQFTPSQTTIAAPTSARAPASPSAGTLSVVSLTADPIERSGTSLAAEPGSPSKGNGELDTKDEREAQQKRTQPGPSPPPAPRPQDASPKGNRAQDLAAFPLVSTANDLSSTSTPSFSRPRIESKTIAFTDSRGATRELVIVDTTEEFE